MKEISNEQEKRRKFLKKAWVVPTLFALGTLEAKAAGNKTASELCEQTGPNSVFCECVKDPNSSPACNIFLNR